MNTKALARAITKRVTKKDIDLRNKLNNLIESEMITDNDFNLFYNNELMFKELEDRIWYKLKCHPMYSDIQIYQDEYQRAKEMPEHYGIQKRANNFYNLCWSVAVYNCDEIYIESMHDVKVILQKK